MNEVRIEKTGQQDVVSTSDGRLTLSVPIQIKRRGGRKVVRIPDGNTLKPRPINDKPTPIQMALARGHRWLAMIDTLCAAGIRPPFVRGCLLSFLSTLAIDPLAGESLELRPEAALQKCLEEVEDVDTERRIEDEVHPIGVC